MHRIFAIKELVDQILSGMSPSELTTTARVNHIWFFASLPNIWRSVTVWEALKPLKMCNNEECPYEPPTLDWDRFSLYSRYVRVLIGLSSDIHVLRNATRFQPDALEYLFPNLRSLTWHCPFTSIDSLPDFPVLVSPCSEIIRLELFDLSSSFFHSFCEILSTRAQGLRLFQIRLFRPSRETVNCNNSFNQVLRTFASTLTHIHMPEEFHTEETVEQLRNVRNLNTLMIGTSFEPALDGTPMYMVRSMFQHNGNREEDFGSLESLSLIGSQTAFRTIFLNKFTFPLLREINWHQCEELEDLKSFATTISNACPCLELLVLGESDMYLDKGHLPPIIPWKSIRSLLGCVLLVRLSLHCCRVSMTTEELIELLMSRLYCMPTAWYTLEIYTEDPLSISDLLLFAKYCPYLRHLGMHFDGLSSFIPYDPSVEIQQPIRPSPRSQNFLVLDGTV